MFDKKIIAQNRINELKKKVENFENEAKQLGKSLEALANQKDELLENLKDLIAERKKKSTKL
jgi:predicted transcriptional regulator